MSLGGQRVVVTRAAHQASGLIELLEAAGAEAAALPLIEVIPPADPRPLERAATELALYRWLVLTSANAARALLDRCGGVAPPGLAIAVIGQATAAALADYGLTATLIAERSRAEGMLDLLAPRLGRGERVMLPQAADAGPLLAEGLRAAGAEVRAVTAYDKRLPDGAASRARELFAAGPLGWVTFTSPRIARSFAALFDARWEERRASLEAASIGPVTSDALRALGVEPAAQAQRPGDQHLVAAIEAAL